MQTLSNLFPLVIMVAVFWFLIIRPNRRRQQAAQALINSVGAGSKVVLASGLKATVVRLEDDVAVLEVAPGIELRYLKAAITKVEE